MTCAIIIHTRFDSADIGQRTADRQTSPEVSGVWTDINTCCGGLAVLCPCMQLASVNTLPVVLLVILSMRCAAFGRSSHRIPHFFTSITCPSKVLRISSSPSSFNLYHQKEPWGWCNSQRGISSSSSSSSSVGSRVKSNMASFEPSTNTHIVDHLKTVQAKIEQVNISCKLHTPTSFSYVTPFYLMFSHTLDLPLSTLVHLTILYVCTTSRPH